MSKLQELMADATEVTPSRKRDESPDSQEYMTRLATAVGKLPDEDWAKLPKEAHDWYNAAVDAVEAKKPIPGYPDDVKEEAAPSRRRGGSAATAAAEDKGPATLSFKDLKTKMEVTITTKRGKKVTGKVVELDDDVVFLKTEDGEEELMADRIDSIVEAGADEGEDGSGGDEPGDPEVGDTVEVVTKRDKVVVGNVTEITDNEIVLKTSTGDVEEFAIDRVKSVTVKVKNGGKSKASSKASSKDDDKDDDKSSDGPSKGRRTSAKDNGGVSVTVRMRQIMCDNLGIKRDAVAAQMKKEGLTFKDETLNLVYNETSKIIDMLRERNLLKK